MSRRHGSMLLIAFSAATFTLAAGPARAVNPNPLQSAYWRLEEGVAGQNVPAGVPDNEAATEMKYTVHDSLNNNANPMQAFNSNTSPKYVNTNLPPTYLASGAHNTLAWEVIANQDEVHGQDAYTNGEDIQNGVFGPSQNPPVTGFTLEAAFKVYDYDHTRAIVGKEGRPGLKQGFGDPNLPTLGLKVLGTQFEGDPDAGKIAVHLFDEGGNERDVLSTAPVNANQWYYAAVVDDGQKLSLYVNSNDGNGYVLQGQTDIDGVLFQGTNRSAPDWDKNWSIGRVIYGGNADPNHGGAPGDFFRGLIDEVRLTNSALSPSQFLFTNDLLGDFNKNGKLEGGDFLTWQRGFGGAYDSIHYDDWATRFGNQGAATANAQGVPEPAAALVAGAALGLGWISRRRRAR